MDPKYLNFHVSEIPFIVTDREKAMDDIISYALVSMAEQRGITLKAAGKVLGISLGSEEIVKESALRCSDTSRSFTSIRKDLAFDFRDQAKSEFDVTCLCANLAIRSIIGKREFILCRKAFVFSRMSGSDTSISPRFYSKYVKPLAGNTGRRRWERVRDEVKTLYGLRVYAPPGCKGFYVSYNLSEEKLAYSVERMILNRKAKKTGLSGAALRDIARKELECTP